MFIWRVRLDPVEWMGLGFNESLFILGPMLKFIFGNSQKIKNKRFGSKLLYDSYGYGLSYVSS